MLLFYTVLGLRVTGDELWAAGSELRASNLELTSWANGFMFSFTPHSLLFVNKILKYLCTKSLRDAALLEEVTGCEFRAAGFEH